MNSESHIRLGYYALIIILPSCLPLPFCLLDTSPPPPPNGLAIPNVDVGPPNPPPKGVAPKSPWSLVKV